MNGLMDTEGSLKSQSQKKLVSILLYGSDTSDRKTKRKALIACVTLWRKERKFKLNFGTKSFSNLLNLMDMNW